MSDAHDEAAKAKEDKYYDDALTLMDAWWRKGGNAYELTPEDVSNALRKAAADEREACIELVDPSNGHISWKTCNAFTCLSAAAGMIKARAKGGA